MYIPGSAILKPELNVNRPPFIIPAIIFLVVSIPLVLGWIPKNRFYGVRTRKTLADEHVWFAVNRLGGLLIIACSLIYLLIAALIPFSSDITSPNWWAHMAGFAVPLVVSFLTIHIYTKRL
jgi:UDP-N-acetylmuramyl pentapeptide phosphotransferase/UDP-N-acetylglucosamine-1-phosphate transferase